MKIFINHNQVSIQENSSFELIFENRYFSNSDAFSFSINFPLKGCYENIKVFGPIMRKDVIKNHIVYDCDIYDKSLHLSGVIAITEVTDSAIKAQFLSERSAQNYNITFDDVYINNLDLGSPFSVNPSNFTPQAAWGNVGSSDNFKKYVAIPWVNNTSGNIQNEVDYSSKSGYTWNTSTTGLSFMPYLLWLTKNICNAIGYSYDFTEWENSKYRFLLVTNTLPYAWEMTNFASALPHWSVKDFFRELEDLMNCEINIDYSTKHISFNWGSSITNNAGTVYLENAFEEYTTEFENELSQSANNSSQRIFKYANCSHNMWKYYSCDWLFRELDQNSIINVETQDELDKLKSMYKITPVGNYSMKSTINQVIYYSPLNIYLIIVPYHVNKNAIPSLRTWNTKLVPINQFTTNLSKDDEEIAEEINIVPAWIDETDKGNCVFIECSSLDNALDETDTSTGVTAPMARLKDGETDRKEEYLDKIFVAFWNGYSTSSGEFPCPTIDKIIVKNDWDISEYTNFGDALRLNNNNIYSGDITYKDINQKQKYTFKFISKNIPNVRAIFYINGKRYVCTKLTTTFTENGRSELVKGEFFPIL